MFCNNMPHQKKIVLIYFLINDRIFAYEPVTMFLAVNSIFTFILKPINHLRLRVESR